MEKLIVKNFGPLKDVEVDLKDINVFIGPNGSGKSTLAKLVAVFNSDFEFAKNKYTFIEYLKNFEIDYSFFHHDTCIEFKFGTYFWKYEHTGGNVITNYPLSETNIRDLLVPTSYRASESDKVRLEGFKVSLRDIDSKYIDDNSLTEKIKVTIKLVEQFLPIQIDIGNLQTHDDLIIGIIENIKNIQSQLRQLFPRRFSTYVPVERTFFATFNDALYSILSSKIRVPWFLNQFGNLYSLALSNKEELEFPTLKMSFRVENSDKQFLFYVLPDGSNVEIRFAASGVQSMGTAAIVVELTRRNSFIIIEEPELNLFPSLQNDFLKFIIRDYKKNKSKVLMATHSPYILSALDNLILANNVAQERKGIEGIDEKVKSIVPQEYWVNYDDVSAYYFNEDGTVHSILNSERRGIGGNEIDEASIILEKGFDQLLELRYP